MLKAQLHTHCKSDPEDKISYSAYQLIDHAAAKGFDVLSITCHNKVVYSKELSDYAEARNILLIPGVEKTIKGKHVLIYNTKQEEIDKVKSFDDLKDLKYKKDSLIIAPHPFFVAPSCLKNKIIKYFDLFDAWEYSFFYWRFINPNRKMLKLNKRYHKPIIGSSDVHSLEYFENTYTQIDAEKNIESVIKAIKDRKTRITTKSLNLEQFLKITWRLLRKDL